MNAYSPSKLIYVMLCDNTGKNTQLYLIKLYLYVI